MSKQLIIVALLLMIIVNTLAEDKLQIGIKKKVENCEQKSRKGDRLHMHYTVIRTYVLSYQQINVRLGHFEIKWKKI